MRGGAATVPWQEQDRLLFRLMREFIQFVPKKYFDGEPRRHVATNMLGNTDKEDH